MLVLRQSLHNLQGFNINITRITIFTGGCVCKYYDRQVAERSEEKRCKAEEEAEKPGRGFDKNIELTIW